MDSYFYFLYPKFLLKHQKPETLEKFNEVLDSINKLKLLDNGNINEADIKTVTSSINKYIDFYQDPFKCFQLKICTYLQKKQKEFLSKYEYKDEDNNHQ